MGRMLLLAGLVLALCVGLGLLLQQFRMSSAARPDVVERHLAEEVALMHEVAQALAASDLNYPKTPKKPDRMAHQESWQEYRETLNALTAPVEGFDPQVITGIKFKVKDADSTRMEIWVRSPESGRDVYGFTRLQQQRPELGQAIVVHAEVDGAPTAAYRAEGPPVEGRVPSFEILVDIAWLEEQEAGGR